MAQAQEDYNWGSVKYYAPVTQKQQESEFKKHLSKVASQGEGTQMVLAVGYSDNEIANIRDFCNKNQLYIIRIPLGLKEQKWFYNTKGLYYYEVKNGWFVNSTKFKTPKSTYQEYTDTKFHEKYNPPRPYTSVETDPVRRATILQEAQLHEKNNDYIVQPGFTPYYYSDTNP